MKFTIIIRLTGNDSLKVALMPTGRILTWQLDHGPLARWRCHRQRLYPSTCRVSPWKDDANFVRRWTLTLRLLVELPSHGSTLVFQVSFNSVLRQGNRLCPMNITTIGYGKDNKFVKGTTIPFTRQYSCYEYKGDAPSIKRATGCLYKTTGRLATVVNK